MSWNTHTLSFPLCTLPFLSLFSFTLHSSISSRSFLPLSSSLSLVSMSSLFLHFPSQRRREGRKGKEDGRIGRRDRRYYPGQPDTILEGFLSAPPTSKLFVEVKEEGGKEGKMEKRPPFSLPTNSLALSLSLPSLSLPSHILFSLSITLLFFPFSS